MKRYLDAEDVKKKLLEVGFGCEDKIDKWIGEIPTSDIGLDLLFPEELKPTEVKGEWIDPVHEIRSYSPPDSITYTCSVCGHGLYTVYEFPPKVCPHCLSDMSESVKKIMKECGII